MKLRNVKLLCAAAILVALPTSPAMAGEFSAIVNGKSFHLNSSYDWNENNYGLGLEYAFESQSRWKKTAMANGFRDSNDTMSYMIGGGIHRQLYRTERLSGFYVTAGINAFVMTRDDIEHSKPFPCVLPSVSIGNEQYGFNLTYLPRKAVELTTQSEVVDPTISGILFVQFKISFDLLLP